jgi:hypothetical protein
MNSIDAARHAATVVLWALAIMSTLVIVADRDVFTYLGPLYAVCMIGSVVAVRKAQLPPDKPAV